QNKWCPSPHKTESAKCFVEGYAVGTRGRYVCNKGFRRKPSQSNLLECKNNSGHAQWAYLSDSFCEGKKEHVGKAGWVFAIRLIQRKETPGRNKKINCKSFCGDPKPHENATIEITLYVVGQKLLYRCLEGYKARSSFSMCEKSSKGAAWTTTVPGCSNDTHVSGKAVEPVSKGRKRSFTSRMVLQGSATSFPLLQPPK
uniref:Interleukin-2 receptor subunit alpha n=1 Tax=Salvator merianae TaxID=96440 RepID=A0A8D0BK95_SALMN